MPLALPPPSGYAPPQQGYPQDFFAGGGGGGGRPQYGQPQGAALSDMITFASDSPGPRLQPNPYTSNVIWPGGVGISCPVRTLCLWASWRASSEWPLRPYGVQKCSNRTKPTYERQLTGTSSPITASDPGCECLRCVAVQAVIRGAPRQHSARRHRSRAAQAIRGEEAERRRRGPPPLPADPASAAPTRLHRRGPPPRVPIRSATSYH